MTSPEVNFTSKTNDFANVFIWTEAWPKVTIHYFGVKFHTNFIEWSSFRVDLSQTWDPEFSCLSRWLRPTAARSRTWELKAPTTRTSPTSSCSTVTRGPTSASSSTSTTPDLMPWEVGYELVFRPNSPRPIWTCSQWGHFETVSFGLTNAWVLLNISAFKTAFNWKTLIYL